MRKAATAFTEARIQPAARSLRRLLPVPAAGLAGWLMLRGQPADGAVLGLLAAGGWGLGMIPVHADRWSTGPVRRRTGEARARVEAEPPIG
ncbi:hypothetical protein ACWDRR_21380 [Kitasatospora sp. NPDC003701]